MEGLSEFIFNIVFSVLGIVIPVFATVYTVNKRIKAQTKENHQPHIVLGSIEKVEEVDEYNYHYLLLGNNYKNIDELNEEKYFGLKINLKNIGYGVSSNIKFYDLNTGKQINGHQKTASNLNQQLFTTVDIASSETKDIYFCVYSKLFDKVSTIESDSFHILCIYKDLNNNIDSFIMTISWKTKKFFDYYAYQPSSLSYRKFYEQNKKTFKEIYQKYSDL